MASSTYFRFCGRLSSFLFLLAISRYIPFCYSLDQAAVPPRGWNSYDAYSWIISEEQFLQNAKLVSKKLLTSGYEYVVVDFLWYRKMEQGASVTSPGFDTIDEWGRPIPDPVRWPSSVGGKGFKPLADQVHAMGLKFGIHVMRGISTQAVKENTPIFGTQDRARDIALQSQPCSWMPDCFLSVNVSSNGGKSFIQSLYDLYASWDVDFVKHDCVFGSSDFNAEEVATVSQAILATQQRMIYSISPGVKATPQMARLINRYVNMYRVTSDDWDTWSDLRIHFDVARDFASAGLIGARGLMGFSWPDLDMLPMGNLTDPGANHGPKRLSRLTIDEQRTQVTLWAMAKSPLMFGGDMISLNERTFSIITNPDILDVNTNSFGNMEVQTLGMEFFVIPSGNHKTRVSDNPIGVIQGIIPRIWVAQTHQGLYYVAIFNLDNNCIGVSVSLSDIIGRHVSTLHEQNQIELEDGEKMGIRMPQTSITGYQCNGHESWSNFEIGRAEKLNITLCAHGCALFVLQCKASL